MLESDFENRAGIGVGEQVTHVTTYPNCHSNNESILISLCQGHYYSIETQDFRFTNPAQIRTARIRDFQVVQHPCVCPVRKAKSAHTEYTLILSSFLQYSEIKSCF